MKSLIAKGLLLTMTVLGFSVPAFAYVGQTSENAGTVASQGYGTLGYEITITGLNTLCPGRNFAYIGLSDNNASTEIGAVINARKWNSNLYIYWIVDANLNCHITRMYY